MSQLYDHLKESYERRYPGKAYPTKRQLGIGLLWVLLIVGIVFIARDPTVPTLVVTKEQYGSRWPWPSFDRGELSCAVGSRVTIKLGKKTYGLNGLAQSEDYPDSRLLMLREPGTESISADGKGIIRQGASSEIIQIGLKLCGS